MDLKFKELRIVEVPVSVKYDDARKSRVVKSIFGYSTRALSIITKTLLYHRPMLAFGVLSGLFIGGGILAKIFTISGILIVNTSLSTGFIILGAVSLMLGVFANVVFKRQKFAERDLRHYLNNSSLNIEERGI